MERWILNSRGIKNTTIDLNMIIPLILTSSYNTKCKQWLREKIIGVDNANVIIKRNMWFFMDFSQPPWGCRATFNGLLVTTNCLCVPTIHFVNFWRMKSWVYHSRTLLDIINWFLSDTLLIKNPAIWLNVRHSWLYPTKSGSLRYYLSFVTISMKKYLMPSRYIND